MRFPSCFIKCSVCLGDDKLTYEHIIPESLGGFLEVNLQCGKCNNDLLGSKLIPKAKKIYPIRLAIHSLKSELPELFKSIEEGQKYSAKSSDETISSAFLKNGEIISKAGKVNESELKIDKRDTEKNLRGMLSKEGFSDKEIEKKLNEFNSIKVDELFKISNLLTVVKRKFLSWLPIADEVDMDNRIILLIAYNYLCITTGEMIFNDYFDSIREFIKSGTPSNYLQFEQFPYNGPYKPFHKIYLETLDDRTKVTILLFGSIAYKVTFLKLKIMSNDNNIIIQELTEKKLYFAKTIQEAKEGLYYYP